MVLFFLFSEFKFYSFYFTAAIVFFSRSMYSVVENEASVKLALDLSNTSSTNITVQVLVEGGTATG